MKGKDKNFTRRLRGLTQIKDKDWERLNFLNQTSQSLSLDKGSLRSRDGEIVEWGVIAKGLIIKLDGGQHAEP